MKIKLSDLRRLLKEAVDKKELSQDEVRVQFPGALEAAEVDNDGSLTSFDASPDGTQTPYLRFYVDGGGRLLMSNYEIGWTGWSEWDPETNEWYDADDMNDEEVQSS
jgi:hypothetical protein